MADSSHLPTIFLSENNKTKRECFSLVYQSFRRISWFSVSWDGWGQYYVTYVSYFSFVFSSLFDFLNERLRDITNTVDVAEFENLRILHVRLCELVKDTDKCFSPGILIMFFNGILFCCICGTLMAYSSNNGMVIELVTSFIVLFTGMFISCTFSENMQNKGSQFFKIVQTFKTEQIPLESLQQVILSTTITSENGICFTASGFFAINRSLMTTIIGAIITYTVIMIQTGGI
ncbi:uncharacterized protein LOC143251566 [Tachypleus tridentatus]|uniref:uncharacterized protein LOC143251566 n=3 Tax=Tachypleus tridentatus TaxID=6853 RepID=UPI003FCF6CFA